VKEKDQKERDWDREMREVDKLLAKLPDAEPTLGRGVPTVPVSPRPSAGGVASSGGFQPGPARGRAWLTTWLRVGLGLGLGIGMLVWPYSHACGLKLVFLSYWRDDCDHCRRLERADVIGEGGWASRTRSPIILIIWGLGLAGRQLLPRLYGKTPVPFFCPEP